MNSKESIFHKLYMNKSVSFVTGAPGTGKSAIMGQLARFSRNAGRRPRPINDYSTLKKIAQKNRGNPSIATWHPDENGGEFFVLNPEAYPYVSSLVASTIAHNMWWTLLWNDDIFIEIARGAGVGPYRDRYDTHGFDIIVPKVRKVAGDTNVKLANYEVVVYDHDLVRRRMDERYAKDPSAAPSFVFNKYLGDDGYPMPSVQQALPYGFAINEIVDNGTDTAAVAALIGRYYSQLHSS